MTATINTKFINNFSVPEKKQTASRRISGNHIGKKTEQFISILALKASVYGLISISLLLYRNSLNITSSLIVENATVFAETTKTSAIVSNFISFESNSNRIESTTNSMVSNKGRIMSNICRILSNNYRQASDKLRLASNLHRHASESESESPKIYRIVSNNKNIASKNKNDATFNKKKGSVISIGRFEERKQEIGLIICNQIN